MTREEAHTLLEVMAIELTGELVCSGHLITEQTKLLSKQLEAIDMAIEALEMQNNCIICPRCGRKFSEYEGRKQTNDK